MKRKTYRRFPGHSLAAVPAGPDAWRGVPGEARCSCGGRSHRELPTRKARDAWFVEHKRLIFIEQLRKWAA